MRSIQPYAIVTVVLALLAVLPMARAEPEQSGLPLPRFVSLRSGETNMRSGPGEEYPVEWVYKRRGLPMEVIAEYYLWRRVRDWQGVEGWMHSSVLSGRRSIIVTGTSPILRQDSDSASRPVAQTEANVIGDVLTCRSGSSWCKVSIGGAQGWLRRSDIWGVYDDEVFE